MAVSHKKLILDRLEKGPCRSTELTKILVARAGVTDQNARKILSRMSAPVQKVPHISLPNREQIFHLARHGNTSLYYDVLKEILEDANTAEGRVLRALSFAGEVTPRSYLSKASGTTFKQFGRKHLDIDTVLERLKKLDLVEFVDDTRYGQLVVSPGYKGFTSTAFSNFEIEAIFLSIISTWAIKLGFSSSGSLTVRDDTGCVGSGMFEWDLVGPCFLNGVVSKRSKVKNGYFIGDIAFGHKIQEKDIEPFVHKIKILNYQNGIHPFQPIFMAESFDEKALYKLRGMGVIIATPSNILNKEAADLLKDLKTILKKAYESIKSVPDNAYDIINKIAKIEGVASNMRGLLLDFLIARIKNHLGYSCKLREKYRTSSGERFEFDVVCTRGDERVFIEGKGLASGNALGAEEIMNWRDNTLPKLMKLIKEDADNSIANRVEFWVSTEYHPDCKEVIDALTISYKKVKISFHDSSDIIDQLSAFNDNAIVGSFREQFRNKAYLWS